MDAKTRKFIISAVDRTWVKPEADKIKNVLYEDEKYIKWLEQRLIETEPSILCDVVATETNTWCEINCKNMKPECLRKCFEICNKEK